MIAQQFNATHDKVNLGWTECVAAFPSLYNDLNTDVKDKLIRTRLKELKTAKPKAKSKETKKELRKTLTGMKNVVRNHLLKTKRSVYGECTENYWSAIGEHVSTYWANNKQKFSYEYRSTFPILFHEVKIEEDIIPEIDSAADQAIREEFNMPSKHEEQQEFNFTPMNNTDTQSDMWTVKCYNPSGEYVTSKMMTAEEVIYQFVK